MANDYDIVSGLYDHYAQFDFDIDFYLNRYSNFNGNVLELMAGSGRLSIPLLKNGINLDCVDLSGGLLEKLKCKIAADGLESKTYRQNICALQLSDKYDSVIIACNSLSEIVGKENRRKVFCSVYDLLSKKGEFVITLHNPSVRRKTITGAITHVKTFKVENEQVSFSMASNEDAENVVDVYQFYETYDKSGNLVNKKLINLKFELINKSEIEKELLSAGFAVKEVYGNFDMSNYDDEKSPYIIVIAIK